MNDTSVEIGMQTSRAGHQTLKEDWAHFGDAMNRLIMFEPKCESRCPIRIVHWNKKAITVNGNLRKGPGKTQPITMVPVVSYYLFCRAEDVPRRIALKTCLWHEKWAVLPSTYTEKEI
jgi:hypothetical protein